VKERKKRRTDRLLPADFLGRRPPLWGGNCENKLPFFFCIFVQRLARLFVLLFCAGGGRYPGPFRRPKIFFGPAPPKAGGKKTLRQNMLPLASFGFSVSRFGGPPARPLTVQTNAYWEHSSIRNEPLITPDPAEAQTATGHESQDCSPLIWNMIMASEKKAVPQLFLRRKIVVCHPARGAFIVCTTGLLTLPSTIRKFSQIHNPQPGPRFLLREATAQPGAPRAKPREV